ncbi:OsmC family protein [Vagococcus hydrophili]|uniref:OsmC family protein n=1 Tax=Vagococcus hydrophili TaxID=2714947 RepID=A0A6G8AVQ1_9ENTE|nr:OsmC family protein [Vagococcus hydrophili]QIL49015.1 OsmC family protein [Vagococcus hydrophili]
MSVDKIELIQGEKGMELPVATGNWVMLRNEGYSPVQSMVGAIGACGAYVYQSILESSRIEYVFEKVEIEYERDTEIQSEPLKEVKINFFVKVDEKSQGRAERGLKLISKHCPVMQSLDPRIKVVEEVNFI